MRLHKDTKSSYMLCIKKSLHYQEVNIETQRIENACQKNNKKEIYFDLINITKQLTLLGKDIVSVEQYKK